ncbi:oxidoreductase [Flavobacterium faecale]|uniref:Oxidoreductase n=1 Tax=Flavobacterium faecale TaxID=1355330 RepID=A0A2S1LI33_9FLAO|nr:NAD(P)/FAD-dependent oxidoreductase [Flavobacterium faecale]AWG23442.1 oxidoreductase [Flavobacterium faecale]
MKKEEYKIYIVGAGISGLIAARVLEENGFCPTIIEATDQVGGRVKTDTIDGYQLDHGFQVLLTAYPAVQKYLNSADLDLQYLLPGATIFKNGVQKTLGDPLRAISLLFPTLFSGIGSLSDKIKILKLNLLLKKTNLDVIFAKPEKTTLQYLKDFGFSDEIITTFFKPFFAGIFLEPSLQTSSRMFEFVYKMFGEGSAALPKAGMEVIPIQIKANLKQTAFLFNTKVSSVQDGKITLENGEVLNSDYVILATEKNDLIKNDLDNKVDWKSCETFYFVTEKAVLSRPIIGLVADKDALVNNIFYHTSVATKSSGAKDLLSVTVVKDHGLTSENLRIQVEEELKQYCGINDLRFIKQYSIIKALPNLENLKYEMEPLETMLSKGIFVAGDTLLNGSLNAAMISGERAALGVVQAILNDVNEL